MELLQLRYFYESAQNENFSRTAAAHMVPPSAVSLSVKRLEKELGVALFTREGNRVRLNSHGRRLRAALEIAFSAIDGAVAALTPAAGELSGEISLLIRCHRDTVTRHIAAFRRQHPQVNFRVSHNFGGDTVGYDVIIDDDGADYPGMERQALLKEPLRMVAAADSPLCGRPLSPAVLREQPFISMSRGASLRRQTEQACRRAGFTPHVIIECDDPHYLRQYVRQGFGVALVPEISWREKLDEGLAFLDAPAIAAMRTVCLYRRPRAAPAVAAFCRALTAGL